MKVKESSYWKNIYHKKVAVFGPYAPPYGGVSVHIQRVKEQLGIQQNSVLHFDSTLELRFQFLPAYLILMCAWMIWHRPKLVIYNSISVANCSPELKILVFFKKLFLKELILIEHNCRHMYQRSAKFKKDFNSILNNVDKLILIGSKTYASYVDNQITHANVLVEDAFLPPNINNEQSILATYPVTLFNFLSEHNPVILFNASHLSVLATADVYGIYPTLAMVQALIKQYPNIGIIFAIPTLEHEQTPLHAYVQEKNLEQQVYFLVGQKELWPLYKKVDLFIRPTLSDGASVSVQEALYFKVPVIASDACERPTGTILFKTGDTADFIGTIRIFLEKQYEHINQQYFDLHPQ